MSNQELAGLNHWPPLQIDRARKVSIVILNLNGHEHTRDCLESLRQVRYLNREVILVDNGSTDDSPRLLRQQFPEIRLLTSQRNLGFGGGCNLGIEDALGRGTDYVLLLNNDTLVDPDFLLSLVQAGEADSRNTILGPKIYYASDPRRIWFAGGFVSLVSGRYGHIGQGKIDENSGSVNATATGWITGCALLIKSFVFEEIGLLDSKLFAYAEDADFCFRNRAAGYKCILVPSAKVWHKISRTSGGQSPFTLYLGTRNQLIWISRHVPYPYKPLALAYSLTKKFLKASLLLLDDTRSARAVLSGIAAFFARRLGPPGKELMSGGGVIAAPPPVRRKFSSSD
jgi:GT2 family glycosyltransferase